jgi:hypothetical protein
MDPQYKILRMKDLAEKLGLESAKTFKKSEDYLEYAIKEINSKSKFYWHQYLFLIDILYVVIVAKSSVASAYTVRTSVSAMASPPSYDATVSPAKAKKEANRNAKMADEDLGISDEALGSKVHRTKLSWNH